MARPKRYPNPDDAKRELRMRPVEKAGVYVVRGEAGIWDARHYRAGDLIPGHYEYSHQRGERPATATSPRPAAQKAASA